MEVLTYKKLGNDTISIDLHNGFSVIAIESFDYETKKIQCIIIHEEK